jgi:hypothetical protein
MIIERLARLGYASVGIVYMIVGGFAVAAGLGERGQAGSQSDAFAFILRQPFGRALLIAIAVGLCGYVLWRFTSAVMDDEHRGNDAKGIGIRLGSFGRGIVYAVLAVEAIRMAMHRGGGGRAGEQQTRHWTGRLMNAPFGQWLLAAVGLGVVGYGAYQLYKAWDSKLSKRIRVGEIDGRVRRKVIAISRFGIGARGVVFIVIGGSLLIAAFKHNPGAAHNSTGALQILPPAMLTVVGAGLAAYGVYAMVNARYRRM